MYNSENDIFSVFCLSISEPINCKNLTEIEKTLHIGVKCTLSLCGVGFLAPEVMTLENETFSANELIFS